MRDQTDGKPIRTDRHDRQADPVDGDAPLGDHLALEPAWEGEADLNRVFIDPAPDHVRHLIDVPRNNVALQAVTNLHRPFQIDQVTCVPLLKSRLLKSLGH